MWKNTKYCAIAASAALNVAFIAMWIAHAAPPQVSEEQTAAGGRPAIWCPLHRELGVTEEQWVEIEPRLREFQAAVGEVFERTKTMWPEVIDLIAAEEPDVEAIRAKQDEILTTKQRIQRLVVDHLLAEKEVLTPEQQRRLFEMLRNRACCAAGPPMGGRARGEFGPALQQEGGARK